MSNKLDNNIAIKIKELCAQGDRLLKNKEYKLAKQKYLEALKLVPTPHQDWDTATWIYVAIGDANYFMQEFERMNKCFMNAVQCPNGLGNPFIHLRLGQSFFELNDFEKASDEMVRAYMGAGKEIFDEDDSKYFDFLKTVIQI